MNFLSRIAKRDGVYVSRPVLNADAWVRWAEKFGVPNVIPADKMHVTVLASRKNVATKPQAFPHQVYTEACFAEFLGTDNSVLTICWCLDWTLADRYYTLLSMGGMSDWPDYRPHITLSYDAKGFVLPDEAMAEIPPSILFGPEVHAPFAPGAADAEADDEPEEGLSFEDDAVFAARELMQKGLAGDWGDIRGYDRQTISLIASGHPVRKSAIEKLDGKVDFLTVPRHRGILKIDDECRMVYGFASVSVTGKGAVEDSHQDLIKTKALRSLCHGLVKGQRAGKIDHRGAKKTEIVEAMVFDADVWKGMGEYFEAMGVCTPEEATVFKNMKFEGLLTGFHCEDDSMWALAKDADFELSIGASEAMVREIDNG